MEKVTKMKTKKEMFYAPYYYLDPEELLPFIRKWRAGDTEKYSTLVAVICGSAGTSPAELKGKSQSQKPARSDKNIIYLEDRKAEETSYRDVTPEELVPVFRRWKAEDPARYATMSAMICESAGMQKKKQKK